MNIGIVCYPTYGGSGVLATELGIGLAHNGHKVHFITYKKPARLFDFHRNIYFHEVSSFEYPLFEYLPYETALASRMVDIVLHEELDVLHVHYAVPHAAAAYMAKSMLKSKGKDVPVVTTLHGTDITLVGLDQAYAPVVEFSINASDAVTSVSHKLKELTNNSFDVTKDIEVIHNFIDLKKFSRKENPELRSQFAPNGEFVLSHTSNFRKVKRVEDVVRTFERVYRELPSVLLLIGDGPERRNLENLCRTIGLCDKIFFLGKQDAVQNLLSVSDVFLLPSENESFGLSALEAMAAGVPVVSTNIGGIPEVNEEGITGFLLDVGDVRGMSEKVVEILKSKSTLETFRRNALIKAQQFEKSKIIPEYEKVYESVRKSALSQQ